MRGNVDKVLLRAAEGPYRLTVDTEANEEIELLGPQFAEVGRSYSMRHYTRSVVKGGMIRNGCKAL